MCKIAELAKQRQCGGEGEGVQCGCHGSWEAGWEKESRRGRFGPDQEGRGATEVEGGFIYLFF